jgi:chromosome segregation ATPase
MSVECYRSRGKNTYYNEGKRVSKKTASYLSPKLPKCVSKTKSLEIKNLKKQLKEVMTHREQYKTTSSDLDSKLKGMNDQLDKLQEERLTLIEEVNKRGKIIYSKNDEITERMEVIGRLDAENGELKDNLKNSVNELKKLKSEYEDLQDDLEDLKEKATRYYNEGQALEKENRELKDNVKKMSGDYSKLNSYYEALDEDHEELKEKTNSIYTELQTLEEENTVFKQSLIEAENTIGEYTNKYADDMGKAAEEIRGLEETLEQTSKKEQECEDAKLVLQEDINLLRNSAENLRNKLQEEKNECIERVQRAIDETEGNISSRESRKYEKELSDLNGKLRLTEEALDELKKAGTLQGEKLPAKAVKKAIKKLKQAGGKV